MRNWIAAALILVLGLSLTACGNDNAGTTANRWNDAAQQQANARGPIGDQSDGTYHADEHGQVDGFDIHKNLLENNQIYREVYESQTGGGSGDFDEEGKE